ncbi:hypothetical protein V1519DRAFT_98236 [Lipomyces tetrasporus]
MPVSLSGKRRAQELLFQSSETCTLIPMPASSSSSPLSSSSSNSTQSLSPPPREKPPIVTLIMNEPFYIKASTLTDTLTAAEELVYTVTLRLRSTSSHCEHSWPFMMESTPTSSPIKNGIIRRRQDNENPRSSKPSSPSPSPQGTRQSPRNRKPVTWAQKTNGKQSPPRRSNVAASAVASIRRRLGMSLRVSPSHTPSRSDGDADDEHDDDAETSDSAHDTLIELRAEWEFTLLSCPESGHVVQLQLYKNRKAQEVKSGSEIGVEIDMGWSVPSAKGNLKPKEEGKLDCELAVKVNGHVPSHGEGREVRDLSTGRLSTPTSDRELRGEGIVETRYHFATGVNKFRTYTLSGFGCPWCCDKDYHTCERLQFHFMTCHELFSFRLDQRQPLMMDVYITLTGEFLYERASTKVPDMRILQWLRPKSRFRLLDYLQGNSSWLQEGAAALAMQMPMNPFASAVLESRTRSHARQSSISSSTPGIDESVRFSMVSATQGYDVDTVPELPPKARRVFPVPDAGVELYTTKSKRLLKPGEEMSESEDDNDDSWLVHKHEETIDDFEDVTSSEKRFIKAWDRHIFEERPSSYRNVSDSLARFCRKNRGLLSDRSFLIELWKHCLNLVDCGIIEPACFYSCMQWLKAEQVLIGTTAESPDESGEEMDDAEETSNLRDGNSDGDGDERADCLDGDEKQEEDVESKEKGVLDDEQSDDEEDLDEQGELDDEEGGYYDEDEGQNDGEGEEDEVDEDGVEEHADEDEEEEGDNDVEGVEGQ